MTRPTDERTEDDSFLDEADFRHDELRDNIATGTASPAEEGIWERLQRESAATNAARAEKGGA